jgi:hypothetical protein
LTKAIHFTATETFRFTISEKAWASVFIDETVVAMREHMHVLMQEDDEMLMHLTACCYGCYDPLIDKDSGMRAILFFARDNLGAGIVAHELAHACFRIAQQQQWSLVLAQDESLAERRDSGEEKFCYLLERLNAEFWREAYRLGYAQAETQS